MEKASKKVSTGYIHASCGEAPMAIAAITARMKSALDLARAGKDGKLTEEERELLKKVREVFEKSEKSTD